MTTAQLIAQFSVAMAERLDANSHKSGWESMRPRRLLVRLEQEVGELRRALERGESSERVTHEAADVGNFAAMLSENYRARYGEES